MANQFFKSLYFKDYPSNETKCKTFTLAFSEKEEPYYNKIKDLSNIEIRDLIGIDSYTQLYLIAEKEERSLNQIIKRFIKNNLDSNMPKIKSKDVTFVGSKTIPFQRWYPYIDGYSPDFIKSLLKTYNIDKDKVIYEPFAGTGTTIFASDSFNIKTVFSEVNPLLRFLIETKIKGHNYKHPLKRLNTQASRSDNIYKSYESESINQINLFLKSLSQTPDNKRLKKYNHNAAQSTP